MKDLWRNHVKHHPYYKKRKRNTLIFYILVVVGFTIYFGLSLGETFGSIFLYLIALVLIAVFSYMRIDAVFAKQSKKNHLKKELHKPMIGKYTFSYNEEYIVVNDKQHNWNDFSMVDTDDLYVFMYQNNIEKVLVFPKFPKGLPLEERDKLNQIIQEKFNVNTRL